MFPDLIIELIWWYQWSAKVKMLNVDYYDNWTVSDHPWTCLRNSKMKPRGEHDRGFFLNDRFLGDIRYSYDNYLGGGGESTKFYVGCFTTNTGYKTRDYRPEFVEWMGMKVRSMCDTLPDNYKFSSQYRYADKGFFGVFNFFTGNYSLNSRWK